MNKVEGIFESLCPFALLISFLQGLMNGLSVDDNSINSILSLLFHLFLLFNKI